MASKNLLGRARKMDNPYAIFTGHGPFGYTELRLLKTYQLPAKEMTNQYARWFVAVKTPMTHGSFDLGDTYIRDALSGLKLVQSTLEYDKQYDDVSDGETHIIDKPLTN